VGCWTMIADIVVAGEEKERRRSIAGEHARVRELVPISESFDLDVA